ncbi:CYTH domain-containing protein [uncultured Enterovirga sp.]|uniref:CYTH domain-containing protein n=1 Tax=uncultured Enterovirga sp. TaxID=2026352 RepID=UPI0035CBB303
MPVEIERKFLVLGHDWRSGTIAQRFCQGYLASGNGVTVRVRRAGPRAYVTIKGVATGIVRPEFEYPVPVDEAEQMLADLCRRPLIEKMRHEVRYRGRLWQVDVFDGPNAGLVLAEVELSRETEALAMPPWIGRGSLTTDASAVHLWRNAHSPSSWMPSPTSAHPP